MLFIKFSKKEYIRCSVFGPFSLFITTLAYELAFTNECKAKGIFLFKILACFQISYKELIQKAHKIPIMLKISFCSKPRTELRRAEIYIVANSVYYLDMRERELVLVFQLKHLQMNKYNSVGFCDPYQTLSEKFSSWLLCRQSEFDPHNRRL